MPLMGTYAKSLLFLAGTALVAFGTFIVLKSGIEWPSIRPVAADSAAVISCDFNGLTYQEGQARASEDGCNTCVCTETGWSCTKNACVPGGSNNVGTVTGTLGKVDGTYVTDRVCAVDLKDEKRRCTELLDNSPSYAITLPVGSYWIYAEDDERHDGYRAYHSRHVGCQGDCRDHSPLAVEVKAGEIAEAHPKDWDARSWIDRVSVTPSQRLYDSNYYTEGARFNVRSRGLSEVEFYYLFIKVTVQDVDTNPKSIGKAEFVKTDEKGWQYWVLEVPEGFESSRVWPVGRSAEGEIFTGWDLGRTKADP